MVCFHVYFLTFPSENVFTIDVGEREREREEREERGGERCVTLRSVSFSEHSFIPDYQKFHHLVARETRDGLVCRPRRRLDSVVVGELSDAAPFLASGVEEG